MGLDSFLEFEMDLLEMNSAIKYPVIFLAKSHGKNANHQIKLF